MPIFHLARKNVQALSPYQSARRIGGQGEIWLNANEFPSSPHINIGLNLEHLNRYPEDQPQDILERYATYAKVKPQQVIVCRGADESIELLMKAFCEPGHDAIIFCPPTYGMYKVTAETLGIEHRAIACNADFQLDLDAIEHALDNVKLIYICHPNNPTGNTLSLQDIRKLLDLCRDRAIVIVDEAYIEFCPQFSVASWLKDYPHLAILRTLSKAFALAGIRCGFVLANESLIQLLMKVIAPYPIPNVVAFIATQALTPQNIAQMKENVKMITLLRQKMVQELSTFSCVNHVLASETNFILVKFTSSSAIFKRMADAGIILRDQSNALNLNNCIRITIGTTQECQHVINVLNQYEKEEMQ